MKSFVVNLTGWEAIKIEEILEKHYPGLHLEEYSWPAEEILRLIEVRKVGEVLMQEAGLALPFQAIFYGTVILIDGGNKQVEIPGRLLVEERTNVQLVIFRELEQGEPSDGPDSQGNRQDSQAGESKE